MQWFVERVVTPVLAFWARLVVRRRQPFIVGITGSVGKSTTKEAVAAVLMHEEARRRLGRVAKTPGNWNDYLWFLLLLLRYEDRPQSVLRWVVRLAAVPFRALALATVAPYPRVLVIEYAANTANGIERRTKVARPAVAVVTAIGAAHLEGFGSLEQIVRSKGALVRAVAPSGLVVLGADNAHASAMGSMTEARVVRVPGRGRELARNVARVVACHLHLPDDVIDRALADLPPLRGRLDVRELGAITVIDDSHNASPLAMQLALETLASVAAPDRRAVAVLGGMAELGAESARYHAETAALARERSALLVGVGELARAYRADHWFASSAECAEGLPALLAPGDVVLVKGSQSARMSKVVDRPAAARLAPGDSAARPAAAR